jgi:hypothetical protein
MGVQAISQEKVKLLDADRLRAKTAIAYSFIGGIGSRRRPHRRF